MFATFTDWLCLVLMWIVGIVITLQVLNRAVLHIPMPWTEEAARYFFIWLSLMGVIRVARKRAFLKVDLLYMALPDSLKRACDIFAQIVILILTIAILRACAILLPMTMTRYAPAMNISMFWMYVAIPLSMFCTAVYTVRNLYELFAGVQVKEEAAED